MSTMVYGPPSVLRQPDPSNVGLAHTEASTDRSVTALSLSDLGSDSRIDRTMFAAMIRRSERSKVGRTDASHIGAEVVKVNASVDVADQLAPYRPGSRFFPFSPVAVIIETPCPDPTRGLMSGIDNVVSVLKAPLIVTANVIRIVTLALTARGSRFRDDLRGLPAAASANPVHQVSVYGVSS